MVNGDVPYANPDLKRGEKVSGRGWSPSFHDHCPMIVGPWSIIQHSYKILFSFKDKLEAISSQRNPSHSIIQSPGLGHVVDHPSHVLSLEVQQTPCSERSLALYLSNGTFFGIFLAPNRKSPSFLFCLSLLSRPALPASTATVYQRKVTPFQIGAYFL